MKNILKTIMMCLVAMFVLTGCGGTETMIYKGAAGEDIQVRLNTSEGHELSPKLPIEISLDDEVLTSGTFFHASDYDEQVFGLYSLQGVKVLEEDKDAQGNDYVLYSIDEKTFVYLVKVKDSDTAVRLENSINLPTARKVFDLLTFNYKK